MNIDRSKKMYLRRFSVLEKPNESNKIIIWYELPSWIYVNKECAELISYISGKSFEEFKKYTKSYFSVDTDEAELMSIIETLYQASALYLEGEDRHEPEQYSSYTIQYLTFNITNSCNLFCSHCYIDSSNRKSEFMTIGRAKANGLARVNNAAVFEKVVRMYEDDRELINYIPGTLEAVYMSNIKMLNRLVNCGTGMGTLAIQPNGDCFPCPNTITERMNCGNILEQDFRDIWMKSPVLALLRDIRVDKNLDRKCQECEVRYFCGGGCRVQALANTGDLYSLSCTCDFDKELLVEMLWTAAQKPHLFESEAIRQLEFNKQRENETKEIFSKIKDEIIF